MHTKTACSLSLFPSDQDTLEKYHYDQSVCMPFAPCVSHFAHRLLDHAFLGVGGEALREALCPANCCPQGGLCSL